jgi:hypothetical protein
MDANDDDDEHDEPTDDIGEMVYRERAKTMLDRIAAQAKQALSQQGVALDLFFFLTPSSHSVVTFGTMSDPADELWEEVSAVVSTIVREAVGLDQVRCRQVACASTDAVSMHPALQSSGAGR